ncbi:MAG: hypothetical protein IJT87_00590 [Ruminiclostridium sp.]|nr:hypothetical protein [Ruminiclostridium sp.]
MNNDNERCAVCGDPFTGDDVKIYCPECGAPMHKDCYEIEGKCPNSAQHDVPASGEEEKSRERIFKNSEGCEICGKLFEPNDERTYCPECGASMHKRCYSLTHKCPYESEHPAADPRLIAGLHGNGSAAPVCDICGLELKDDDEKVYCPECGTPVHKSCWLSSPVCPNADKHAEGYDWENAHKPVRPEERSPYAPNDTGEPRRVAFENFPELIIEHPIRSPESGEELTCRGVTQSELMHFLGMYNFSTPRFFALFMNMANAGKVISINFSAWIFAPLYHFYRRMTGPAVIITLITFILTIPTLIYEIFALGDTDMNGLDMLFASATVTSYIMIAFRVVLLLFNDYIYMRWCVSKILFLREKYKDEPEDVYFEALEHKGNPRMMYVLGGVSLIMLLLYGLNLFVRVSGIV